MDKAKSEVIPVEERPYWDKFTEVLAMAGQCADDEGNFKVKSFNRDHISEVMHASAMYDMQIASEREEMLFLGNAYQGESGELGNIVKKIARDGSSEILLRALQGEVADNLLYLFHICQLFGINQQEAMHRKIEELLNERQPKWAHDAISAMGGYIHTSK